jgi:type I restriction enzyme S subunit
MSVPVPKLRFKNFSQALINGPFEQYIKSSKYGPRFDANDYDLNGNVKTIRGTDVALDATIKYEQVPIANLPQKLIDEHQLQEGDILMITTADCGLSAVFEKQEIPFIASAYAVRIVLKNSLDSLWVKYYLQTQHIVNEVNKYVRKGTLSNLPLSDISKFSFTVPALEEQTKIATFLSAVDEKISQLTQKHELLSQYKQGMMQKLFSQQLRFKADDGSEFGEWEEVKFSGIFNFHQTNSYSRALLAEYGEIMNIHYGDIHTKFSMLFDVNKESVPFLNDEVDTSKIAKEQFLKVGDLVIADASEDYKDIGKSIEVISLNNQKVVAGLHTYIARPVKPFALGFCGYMMQTFPVREQIKKLATGISVLGISKTNLGKVELKVPSLEEQTKIANFLSAIDQKIEVVVQQIEQAKTWKKGLLQQMFV